MEEGNEYISMGYLKNDFEIFHIKDKKQLEFEFHYHEFDKIIIFISGDVTYLVEGRAYKLRPWNVLFVGSNDIHKPMINSQETYERIVIWINAKFLQEHSKDNCNLLCCMQNSSKYKRNLLSLSTSNEIRLKQLLKQLEASIIDKEFGGSILKNAAFLTFIVNLNRMYIGSKEETASEYVKSDDRIIKIIDYIRNNLNQELSVEKLAEKFFVNKYYLMHRFKEQTGYTLHAYISQKRLMMAASLLKSGSKPLEIYSQCGFLDYSVFHRGFKKQYGISPKQYGSINSL
ncbi:AraC family transcriptional regulator [Clostridium sp. 19966]|uniref:AraC family transcriptional regulator n=1 Tax=Clostridium sp. 19966 TaxID=2768166 RepID=UPI0028EB2F31|nr:AraC family transcriptional regulator [Clostridium sp. 19966]